jgi:hypothetical protein
VACGLSFISYAVVVLTANTTVNSDGTFMSKDGMAFIATDNMANVYEILKIDGNYCIAKYEAMVIKNQAQSGRNVLVQFEEFDGNHTLVEQLRASGALIDDESQQVCFQAPEFDPDKYLCMSPSESCIPRDSSGRRLRGHTGWDFEIVP